jgi:hypothetical protein
VGDTNRLDDDNDFRDTHATAVDATVDLDHSMFHALVIRPNEGSGSGV